MTDNVVQLRDYQNPKDIERLYADLKAVEAANPLSPPFFERVPYNGAGIDGMGLEKDPV